MRALMSHHLFEEHQMELGDIGYHSVLRWLRIGEV